MPIQRKGMRALQIWCARVTSGYASVEVTDLTSSFRSGLAFVGIIHHFRPDLIQSPDNLDPKDVVGNNALAYRSGLGLGCVIVNMFPISYLGRFKIRLCYYIYWSCHYDDILLIGQNC